MWVLAYSSTWFRVSSSCCRARTDVGRLSQLHGHEQGKILHCKQSSFFVCHKGKACFLLPVGSLILPDTEYPSPSWCSPPSWSRFSIAYINNSVEFLVRTLKCTSYHETEGCGTAQETGQVQKCGLFPYEW